MRFCLLHTYAQFLVCVYILSTALYIETDPSSRFDEGLGRINNNLLYFEIIKLCTLNALVVMFGVVLLTFYQLWTCIKPFLKKDGLALEKVNIIYTPGILSIANR